MSRSGESTRPASAPASPGPLRTASWERIRRPFTLDPATVHHLNIGTVGAMPYNPLPLPTLGPIPQTTPVGAFSPHGDSLDGCAGLTGNVYEWTSTLAQLHSPPPPLRPDDRTGDGATSGTPGWIVDEFPLPGPMRGAAPRRADRVVRLRCRLPLCARRGDGVGPGQRR